MRRAVSQGWRGMETRLANNTQPAPLEDFSEVSATPGGTHPCVAISMRRANTWVDILFECGTPLIRNNGSKLARRRIDASK